MCLEVLVAKKILNEKISFSQCKYIPSLLSTKISGPEVVNLTNTILVEVFYAQEDMGCNKKRNTLTLHTSYLRRAGA